MLWYAKAERPFTETNTKASRCIYRVSCPIYSHKSDIDKAGSIECKANIQGRFAHDFNNRIDLCTANMKTGYPRRMRCQKQLYILELTETDFVSISQCVGSNWNALLFIVSHWSATNISKIHVIALLNKSLNGGILLPIIVVSTVFD